MTDTTEAPAHGKRSLMHRFADWLDAWHVTRIMNAVSAFAILLAIAAFALDMVGRTEERIARAWQLVTTPAPGNSGKIQALEYLTSEDWWWPFKRQVPLVGIDLSKRDKDDPGVYLVNVQLPRAELRHANFSGASLTFADLSGSDASGADFTGIQSYAANFSRAQLDGANLESSDFTGANLNGAHLEKANLRGAKMEGTTFSGADMSMAILTDTDLSQADLRNARSLSQAQLDQAWAWRLHPPWLPDGLTMTRLCSGTDEQKVAFYRARYRDHPPVLHIPPDC